MSEGFLRLLLDTRRAKKQGYALLERRQRARLAEMVAFAREHSPYYRELYSSLPERVEDPALLPVTSKEELMERFDTWVTDRAVTIERARSFVETPYLVGERLLGKYTVLTTSGTTGTSGIFVADEPCLSVTNALALRMFGAWLSTWDLIRIVARGGRLAMVMAAGGHYASAAAAVRLRRRMGRSFQTASVHTPLPDLVAQLNQFRPAVLATYASVGALLAGEQAAGRLQIEPLLVTLTAEGLAAGEYDCIARTFHTKVRNGYAATECFFMGYGCEHGWLHVNADWVVLEPVDADHRPTPPGEQSHTVLISNLANYVQPILRYDLGDRILQRPDACPCGDPLPAIRVQGRSADMLTFPSQHGEPVRIPPLVFPSADEIPSLAQVQIVQTTPMTLRVRLRPAAGADRDSVWDAVHTAITHLLHEHKLDHVTVERAEEPPEQSAGGKYRAIIPRN